MLFSVLTRKGKVPRHNFHPPRSRSWLKRQISAGGSLRPRSPDPAQPPSLREPGAQDPTSPQAPQATQMARARSHRLHPMQTAAVISLQRQGWGIGSLPPQGLGPASGRPWRGLWSPAGHSPQPVPWAPLAHPLARGQVSWRAPGRRLGSVSYLTLCLTTTTPPTVG